MTEKTDESVRVNEFKKEIKDSYKEFEIFKKYNDLSFEKRINYFIEVNYNNFSEFNYLDNFDKIKYFIENNKIDTNSELYKKTILIIERKIDIIMRLLIYCKSDINLEDDISLLNETKLYLSKEIIPSMKLLIENNFIKKLRDEFKNNFIITFIDYTIKYFDDEKLERFRRLKRIIPFIEILNNSDDDIKKVKNLNINNLLDEIIIVMELDHHKNLLDIIYTTKVNEK